jgi:ABC-2 type transport system ATP-binding protein
MPDTTGGAPAPVNAIEARGLRKQYRGERGAPGALALNDVDLVIPRGAFFGLLGPNGAGKSTFINVLAGLVIKSAGQVSIWGHDIDRASRRARASIGVVPQELNLDAFFTPRELLDWQAGLYGVPRAERRTEQILDLVGLADKADSYSRSLSGGMRRRLLVAKAMVHSPPILVLDEPTAGVDIELRHQLWDNIRALNEGGVTVLLTTHYLEEAEQLCDWIAIINHGEVVACDEKSALLGRLDQKELTVMVAEEITEPPAALSAYAPEIQPYGRLVFRYRPSQTQIAGLLEAVRNAGLTIVDLSTEESDLEDLFLELVGSAPER